jgi:GNAT superfamily N-acetyltransferase
MSQITVTIDKRVGIIFKSPFGVCTLSHDVEFIDVPCSPENPEGYEERPYMLISGLDVSPEHRRQGHGRALLRAAVDYAKAEFPHIPLKLAAVPDSDGMDLDSLIAFYESEGFEVVETDFVVCMEYLR